MTRTRTAACTIAVPRHPRGPQARRPRRRPAYVLCRPSGCRRIKGRDKAGQYDAACGLSGNILDVVLGVLQPVRKLHADQEARP